MNDTDRQICETMTGIKELAAATGYSTATVSRALRGLPYVSEKARTIISRRAEELNYVADSSAAGLATGRNMAMNVVVPYLDQWFHTTALDGADSELRAAHYDLVLSNLGSTNGDRERVFHRSILRKRGDAIIALGVDFDASERDELRSAGLPVIVIGGPVRGLRYVGIDQVAAGRQATQHLLDLGHRDILHLSGGYEKELRLIRQVPQGRRRGYEEALRDAGISANPSRTIFGHFSLLDSRKLVRELLSAPGPRPTAIFAASDEMAIGAILALYDLHLSAPGDISVIGIDGHYLAESFGLTTLAQDPFAQGALGARMLLDELNGGAAPTRSVRLPVRLIARTSTGPPHA